MSVNERPTCVTVIGWFWTIVGGIMAFSAVMALFGSVMIDQMSRAHPQMNQDMPPILRFFPLLALIQIAVAVLGNSRNQFFEAETLVSQDP